MVTRIVLVPLDDVEDALVRRAGLETRLPLVFDAEEVWVRSSER